MAEPNLAGVRTLNTMCGGIAAMIAFACLIGAVVTPIVGIPRSQAALDGGGEILSKSEEIGQKGGRSTQASVDNAVSGVCCVIGAVVTVAGLASYLGTIALTALLVGLGIAYAQAAKDFLRQRTGSAASARLTCVTSVLIIVTNLAIAFLASAPEVAPADANLATALRVGPFLNVAIHAFYLGLVLYTQMRPGAQALTGTMVR